MLHASGAQVAFRFNSYVALALAERLAGIQGVAWVALLVALCVLLCNIAAVAWPLARLAATFLARAGEEPADHQHGGGSGLQPARPEAARISPPPRWCASALPSAAAGPDGGGRGP